jgi:hypothetical protein
MASIDDVCALKLCGHIRGEHGTEGRPFEPLARTCLVEGCPCARFVEPDATIPAGVADAAAELGERLTFTEDPNR